MHNQVIYFLAKKGRSHLFLRCIGEDITIKGIKRKVDENRKRYVRAEEKIEFFLSRDREVQ